MNRPRRPLTPLDKSGLDRLALRYVERFATTQAKLAAYLRRKLRERGWAEEAAPEPEATAARMAELGYVNDRIYAEAKAGAMARRGLGSRRVTQALRQAGVTEADAAAVAPTTDARAAQSALALARRKRIGPFAIEPVDRPQREKQLAAMLRAGHAFALARRIVSMAPGEDAEWLLGIDHFE